MDLHPHEFASTVVVAGKGMAGFYFLLSLTVGSPDLANPGCHFVFFPYFHPLVFPQDNYPFIPGLKREIIFWGRESAINSYYYRLAIFTLCFASVG